MNLVVDGVVYERQQFGGINTLHGGVLPRLAARHDVNVHLLIPGWRLGAPPGAPVRLVRRDWIPARTGLDRRLDQRLAPYLQRLSTAARNLWIRSQRDGVFISTFFTDGPAGTPSVAVALDLSHELFPGLYADAFGAWLRERYPVYLRSAARVIAISETTRSHVTELYRIPKERIDVVYLGTDPATYYVDRLAAPPEPYILYVGGRWYYKNFSFVLNAAARGFARLGLSLVVAGSPWSPAESAEIERLDLQGHVRLVTRPSNAELRRLYANAFAFVFPSLHEGFGLPLLEAMACGTPVLAADTPIFREIAGSAPAYFDPRDADSLLEAVARLFTESTRTKHVTAGLAQARRYSWDTTADAMHAACVRALRG